MLPNPLHPAIVHFPVVLAVLLPFFAIGALVAIRRGAQPMRAWALPIVMTGALALSALFAVRTGESQEERVERVVAEQPFEAHENAGEALLLMSAGLFILMGAGLTPGFAGKSLRVAAVAGALVLVGAATWVGKTGGELVYRHGAASAYASPTTQMQSSGEVDH